MSDVLYRPHSILLVEDDPAQREAAIEMLVFMGHDVLSAASGEDALEILRNNRVAALVADVELPGMTGIELATRAVELISEIHVVFTTGCAYLVSAPLPFEFSLVAKPYHYATLKDKLNRITSAPRTVLRTASRM